ncbi:MAG: hypothetical protein EXS63_09075 [Candidatus Omnitrophica bacterium]|nr:hypothetical protein [Candidatus Omnitrophota bacterium]
MNEPNERQDLPRFLVIFLPFAAAFFITVFVGGWILQAFPNSADEYDYLFQARTYFSGRFFNATHPSQTFFEFMHLIQYQGKWYSPYPIGWPLILTGAMLAKVPSWLVNPFLGSLSLLFVFLLGKRLYGEKIAIWAVFYLLSSPFFIFNSASYFSHTLCSLILLMLAYVLASCHSDSVLPSRRLGMAVGGFLIGCALLTRPYTAFWCIFPMIYFYLRKRKRLFFQDLIWLGLGLLPCSIAYGINNYHITGNLLQDVAGWSVPPHLQAPPYPGGYGIPEAAQLLIDYLGLLSRWTGMGGVVIYCFYLFLPPKPTSVCWVDAVMLCLIGGYLFVPFPAGNQYGPRYYYEAFPFMVLSVASNVFSPRSVERGTHTQTVLKSLFFFGMVMNLFYLSKSMLREHEVIIERRDLYDLVEKEKIRNAVIFLQNGTGVKRPMPVWDLLRNGTDFNGSILYAEDKGKRNEELVSYFPGRVFYRYVREDQNPKGRLEKL